MSSLIFRVYMGKIIMIDNCFNKKMCSVLLLQVLWCLIIKTFPSTAEADFIRLINILVFEMHKEDEYQSGYSTHLSTHCVLFFQPSYQMSL